MSSQVSSMTDNYIFVMECAIKRFRQLVQLKLHAHHTGITVDQWIILRQVFLKNASSQVEIAAATAKDAPTTTRIIEQLLSKKLIDKSLDKEDRRKYRVFITEKGSKMVQAIQPEVDAISEAGLNGQESYPVGHLHNILLGILEAFDNAPR